MNREQLYTRHQRRTLVFFPYRQNGADILRVRATWFVKVTFVNKSRLSNIDVMLLYGIWHPMQKD